MPTYGKVIRLACDRDSNDYTRDYDNGDIPLFWRGGVAEVKCALFDGPPATGTLVTDISDILYVELVVRRHNPNGAVLLSILVLAAQFDGAITWNDWITGVKQHFTFLLSEQYTSWDVLASGSLPIHFVINATTASTTYVAAQGYGRIVDVGIVDVNAPALPSGFVSLTPSAAGAYTIVPLRGSAAVRVSATGGIGPYTYVLTLSPLPTPAGSIVDLYIEISATVNPTIEVRNSLGTLLHTVSGDSDNPIYQSVMFRYSGSAWVKFGPAIT